MTKEEAAIIIHKLKQDVLTGAVRKYEPFEGEVLLSAEFYDAINMAIEALEQEPCEDAISRRAALDIIDSYSDSQSNVYDVTQDCISDVIASPPVTPQEPTKTGHWTIKQYQVPIENKRVPTISDITFFQIEPTACKTVYTYTHSACKSEEYLNKYNYCPNCGCKMESGVSE